MYTKYVYWKAAQSEVDDIKDKILYIMCHSPG